jgi:hypothetical protein
LPAVCERRAALQSDQTANTQSRPWQASVQAHLERGVGVDQVEEIVYENGGRFTHRVRTVNGPGGETNVLERQQLEELLAVLQAELQSPPAGVDSVGLRVFIDLIEDTLSTEPPSHRFDNARFGAVTHDESRGIFYGHLGLGVDVAGTVRDARQVFSFEQHVVVLPPGRYRPLSPADQASLARALRANPPADPLWQNVLQDAEATTNAAPA